MPDVKVYHPKGAFDEGTFRDMSKVVDPRANFRHYLEEVVSEELSGTGYEGEPIQLTPISIDVLLIPYEQGDSNLNGKILIEIMGYDYPERMGTIRERLSKIKERIKRGVEQECSISFISLRDGCWV